MSKVMVIDDEHDVRTFLKTFLQDNGYEVYVAVDAEDGLNKISTDKPDLITLDILMPNKTGVKFYREIKKDTAFKDIPVLIISGVTKYGELFSRDHRTLPKPEAFIEKPIDKEVLLNKIKELLG